MWHSCSWSRSFGTGEACSSFDRLPFGHVILDCTADAGVRKEEAEESSSPFGHRRASHSLHAMNAADRTSCWEEVREEEAS